MDRQFKYLWQPRTTNKEHSTAFEMERRTKTTTNLRVPIIHDWFYDTFLLIFSVEFNLGDKNMFGNKFPHFPPLYRLQFSFSFLFCPSSHFICSIDLLWQFLCVKNCVFFVELFFRSISVFGVACWDPAFSWINPNVFLFLSV